MWIFPRLSDHAYSVMETCVGFSQTPELALCVTELVCNCLGSLGPPSVSWGLCALVSAHQACPLCLGTCVHLSWLPTLFLCPHFQEAGTRCAYGTDGVWGDGRRGMEEEIQVLPESLYCPTDPPLKSTLTWTSPSPHTCIELPSTL